MSTYLEAIVTTTTGPKGYIVRKIAGEFFTDGEIGPDDLPLAGDEFAAEDWGPGKNGPYAAVVLQRTPCGWVEVTRLEV